MTLFPVISIEAPKPGIVSAYPSSAIMSAQSPCADPAQCLYTKAICGPGAVTARYVCPAPSAMLMLFPNQNDPEGAYIAGGESVAIAETPYITPVR